ncbi:exodeoxyribonuclease VII large subunit [bacterium BRH_c32]|nr:MAG: exodeoxyribonuclease VII large subunit [bacterium BRH_c32]
MAINTENIFSVTAITGLIKSTLEESFGQISVIGEISNFKAHVSGHWYFTLKDASAQISCTMWKGNNSYVFFTPQDGMKIIVNGKLSVYPPRGTYQIDVRSMMPAGEGELQAAFEKLKRKLNEEGLFDPEIKKEIPQFPKRIGIVTARDGAALQDMINSAKRRFPLAELFLYPSKVQGDGAAQEIVRGIEFINKLNNIDVLILARGGGSLEDLWAFNEEIVARAIFDSYIPIITGIGHEVDFTIADFAADKRASTPTAAMELATPDQEDILSFITDFIENIDSEILSGIKDKRNKLTRIVNSYGFRLPEDVIKVRTQYLDSILYKLISGIDKKLTHKRNLLSLLDQKIDKFDFKKILERGFSLIHQDDNLIQRAENFNKENPFLIKFFDGEIRINNDKKER